MQSEKVSVPQRSRIHPIQLPRTPPSMEDVSPTVTQLPRPCRAAVPALWAGRLRKKGVCTPVLCLSSWTSLLWGLSQLSFNAAGTGGAAGEEPRGASAGQESEPAVHQGLTPPSVGKGFNSINHLGGDCQSVL